MYLGDATLVRAADVAATFAHAPADLSWGEVIPNLSVTWASGDHNTLVLPPHVQALAALISASLANRLAPRGAGHERYPAAVSHAE
jgi:thioesterase domain-containing protein